MFDKQVGGPDAATTLSLVSQAHRQVLAQECALVELAAHWADLHHPDSQVPVEKTLPGAEQGRQLGGDGTPEVLEFAAAELGARMETTIGSARGLMADALDIRHRLPELWQLVVAGRVPSWRARKVAQATRISAGCGHARRRRRRRVHLHVAWGRFETLLAAKIIEADPRAAEEQAKIWGGGTVRTRRPHRTIGVETVDAKANAGDVIWFMATINRIADILRLQGDLDSADVRRSKAIGILAQPALALQLLWEFRGEQHPAGEPQQAGEPILNEPNVPYDRSSAGPAEDPPEGAADQMAQDQPAEEAADPTEEPAGPTAEQPNRGELIIQPSGVEARRLRPQVMLHILSARATARLPRRQAGTRWRRWPLRMSRTHHPRPGAPIPRRHHLRYQGATGHRPPRHLAGGRL